MGQKMTLRFDDASLSDLHDLNSSFAAGRLRVMYTGENRNGSAFSQEVVEAALPSLVNIPIVAHYDLDENKIGSHDVEVVRDEDGLRLRQLTEPCGVVPESVKASFSEEADANGTRHNYLVIEPVILWKRQEVYRHITGDLDGKVDHSMEVNITSFHKNEDEDVLTVDGFEFEALCLLESAEPCFEGSVLEVFSAGDFKSKMEQMMEELRETFSTFNPSESDADENTESFAKTEIDIKETQINTEGGRVLDEKLALLAEYGIDAETLDFSLDDFSVEELREKFEAMKETAEAEPETAETFELSGNLRKVLADALTEKTVERPWGQDMAYWFEDYDLEAGMVYATDCVNWNIYGFPFHMDGDNAVIDFDNAKRMKHAFVEFVEGSEEDPAMPEMFERITEKFQENETTWSEKYNALHDEFESLKAATADIDELRVYKENAERNAAIAEREEVFAEFADLDGNEAFESLRENADNYTVQELTKECFAIRGMNATPAKFSKSEKAPKILVSRDENGAKKEPYGGLFREFGPHRN